MNRRGLVVASAIGLVIAAVLLAYVYWPTPQMGSDEQVMSEVDALFTAVTARSEKLLGESEKRLSSLKTEGKLPEAAAGRIEAIIAEARGGGWESAAKRLYAFIEAQRR